VRPPAVHALVRTHPETGRKALYVNPGQVIDIVGLDPAASDALIAELTAHVESPDGDYRHKWRVGDLVAGLGWDRQGVDLDDRAHPTEPSICSSISRLHSTAYSIGSVLVTGSMNPFTTMPIACSSDRPRLIR